jgi:predicted transcriptional regulator YdeE
MFPKIIQTSSQRFFGIKGRGPFETCDPLFNQLDDIIKASSDLAPHDALLKRAMLYLCNCSTTDKEDLEWAVAALIPPPDHDAELLSVPNGLEEIIVPGRRCATTMHCGPYEGLPKSWGHLCMEWIPSQNLMPMTGSYENVHFEIYEKGCWNGSKELETQLYCPVQEK